VPHRLSHAEAAWILCVAAVMISTEEVKNVSIYFSHRAIVVCELQKSLPSHHWSLDYFDISDKRVASLLGSEQCQRSSIEALSGLCSVV